MSEAFETRVMSMVGLSSSLDSPSRGLATVSDTERQEEDEASSHYVKGYRQHQQPLATPHDTKIGITTPVSE